MAPCLYIIIPCYNEEEVLPVSCGLFRDKLYSLIQRGAVSDESRILLVNDGSKDSTWQIIEEAARDDRHFLGISLSRNRGHQNALWAGLMEAKDVCDITISIDCDGQDDIDAIDRMVEEYAKGSDVVYGVRSDRSSDTFMKRFTAESYYRVLKKLGADVVFNHADYRLMSAEVVRSLSEFDEVNLFLRGLVPMVGYESSTVEYERHERMAGKSHYPLSKMLGLAFDGITSFSVKPLRIIMLFGALVAVVSFIGIIWAIVMAAIGKTIAGWASMTCIICFVSGVQMISIGIIGEYVGKTYMESKHRPKYIISKRTPR